VKRNGCEHRYSMLAELFRSFQPNADEEQNQNNYLNDHADGSDNLKIIQKRSPQLPLRHLAYKVLL